MPKCFPDYITPETSRKVKAMSFQALSRYLWNVYSAGYSAGFLDGLRGVKASAAPPAEAAVDDEQQPTITNNSE